MKTDFVKIIKGKTREIAEKYFSGKHLKTASWIVVIMLLAGYNSGCASIGQNRNNAQIQELQARINDLEQQIDEKNDEINMLQDSLNDMRSSTSYRDSDTTTSANATSRNIQRALKNAGFYKGAIDGKIGKMTKKAIRDFQKENGLKADGVVGKKTWKKLSAYLSGKY